MTKKNQQHHDPAVRAAERRAQAVAFVNQQTAPVRVSVVMEHFNWSTNEAKNTLESLGKSQQIDMAGGGGRGNPKLYAPKGYFASQPTTLPAVADAHAPVVRRASRRADVAHAPGVELVIGGITAVFTKNERTGRPRVTIDF